MITSIVVIVLASLLLTWTVVAVLPSFILAKKGSDMGSNNGGSDSGSGSGSDKGSNDNGGSSSSGSNDGNGGTTTVEGKPQAPSNIGSPDVNPKPGETNDKNSVDKQLQTQTGNPSDTSINLPNIPTTEPIVTNPIIPKSNPIVPATPDKGCAFHPDDPKCKPDKDGNCPTGFSHNVHGNCFPSGKCPAGFGRHDNDETGKCFSNHIHHHPHHTIVIVKHTTSSSSNVSHNLSGKCFSEIKIAWLGKIKRGEFQKVDNIIDKCLGVN